jgi:hypothetical protein
MEAAIQIHDKIFTISFQLRNIIKLTETAKLNSDKETKETNNNINKHNKKNITMIF